MPSKSVLFVIGQLCFGGSEKQVMLTARGLKDRYDVQVVSLSPLIDPFGLRLLEAGVTVLHPPTNGRFSRLIWVLRTLMGRRYDVIFFYSLRNFVALLVILITRGRVVYTERSLGVWKSRRYLKMDGLVYRFCRVILTNARATAAFVAERFPSHARKLRTIPNGIEMPPYVPPPSEGTLTFCMVAGFRPWKGHGFLLDAVARLAAEGMDFRVVLLGDGPTRAAIETLVRAKGLSDRVRFAGWEPHPEKHYAAADANLILSSHESLSNSVMEGMAHGRASIVTRVGGNIELVDPGREGWVVDYGDTDGLAGAMRECIADRGLCRERGLAARAKMESGFSVPALIDRTAALIEELTQS